MPDTPSITLIKKFEYRGEPEEWSNTYHFAGDVPANSAEWDALARMLWTEERKVIRPTSELVRAYGYVAGTENSVAQIDYSLPGVPGMPSTGANGFGDRPAGDQAVWIRAKVGMSSSGKKVYIRKYYHDVGVQTGGGDAVHPNGLPLLQALAVKLISGTMAGGFEWVAPQGANGSEPNRSSFMTTRTLKRRGRRP